VVEAYLEEVACSVEEPFQVVEGAFLLVAAAFRQVVGASQEEVEVVVEHLHFDSQQQVASQEVEVF